MRRTHPRRRVNTVLDLTHFLDPPYSARRYASGPASSSIKQAMCFCALIPVCAQITRRRDATIAMCDVRTFSQRVYSLYIAATLECFDDFQRLLQLFLHFAQICHKFI